MKSMRRNDTPAKKQKKAKKNTTSASVRKDLNFDQECFLSSDSHNLEKLVQVSGFVSFTLSPRELEELLKMPAHFGQRAEIRRTAVYTEH